MPNSVDWPEAIWNEINEAVVKEAAKIRIAQKVFPTTVFENDPTEVLNDVITFPALTIREASTKPFVEIYREFPLTSAQVSKESEKKTGKTLARLAAKEIALAEDAVMLQGSKGALPPNVVAEQLDSAAEGLAGEAAAETVPVKKVDDAARARDSVVARYLLRDGPAADDAKTLVRAYAIAQSSSDGSMTLERLDSMLHGPLTLPDAVANLRDDTSPPPASPGSTAHDLAAQINTLSERHRRLAAALDETAFHAEDELDLEELGERRPLSAMYRTAADSDLRTGQTWAPADAHRRGARPPAADEVASGGGG